MGAGSTRLWRRQWGRRDLRLSKIRSQGVRTRLRSILRRNQLWTSLIGPLGIRKRGCLGGGGIRPASTWRGEEEGGGRSDGLGVGSGLRIDYRPGRRGGVQGSKRVEWIGVEWGGGVTPPRRRTGRKHGRGDDVVANKLT